MSTLKLLGRVVTTIELDDAVPDLDGKRVVIVEEDDAVARAVRNALPDEHPQWTPEERASIEQAKKGPLITTEELRARLAAARRPSE